MVLPEFNILMPASSQFSSAVFRWHTHTHSHTRGQAHTSITVLPSFPPSSGHAAAVGEKSLGTVSLDVCLFDCVFNACLYDFFFFYVCKPGVCPSVGNNGLHTLLL